MEPVIERPALPASLPGLVQSLMAVCQQYGQRINRLILGPHYPITDAERVAGVTPVDYRYPAGHLYRYGTNTTPGTTDMTTAWKAMLSLGGEVELVAPENETSRVTEQLVIKSNTRLVGKNHTVIKDWAGNAGDKYGNACFRNESAPTIAALAVDPPWAPVTTDDDIYIEGLRVKAADSSAVGAAFYLNGTKRLTLKNVVVVRTYEDWAFAIGGENFELDNVSVLENSAVFEDGVHIIYCRGGRVRGNYIQSGDDCYAVGTNWNLPVEDLVIEMGTFRSNRGFAIRLVQNRGGSTAGLPTPTAKLRKITFCNGEGVAGVFRNGQTNTRLDASGLAEDITVSNVTIDSLAETHDGANPFGWFFENVTRLRLVNCTSIRPRRTNFHLINCPEAELQGCIAQDNQGTSSHHAVILDDCANAKIAGGDFVRTLTHPISLEGDTSVAITGATIREIDDNFAGIILDGNAEATVQGVIFRAASGATSASGIRSVASTTKVRASGCVFDVQRPFTYAASSEPEYTRIHDAQITVTIASDAAQAYGADEVVLLPEGGSADSISTLTGAYKGQVVTLRNGDETPGTNTITVINGSGADQSDIGSNYAMGSADSFIMLRYDGTNWKQIARGGTL